MYAKCGCMEEARQVFDKLHHQQDLVSWNSLLQGYVDNGQGEVALKLFGDVQESGDARTYVAALTACSSSLAALEKDGRCSQELRCKYLEKGQHIHSLAFTRRCCNIFVETALLGMYAKCGRMDEAQNVFNNMTRRNLVSWNALLHGYVENGESELAIHLFDNMQSAQDDCIPDARSYVAALTACASLASKLKDGKHALEKKRWVDKGMAVHTQAVNARCCNVFVESSLVDMYSKFGCMAKARSVFGSMVRPNVVSWNALIMGYVENDESELALELIFEMELKGVARDSLTYVAALMAAGNVMAVEQGKAFHAEIRACKLEQHLVVANCLVDFYGKCGCIQDSKQVFDSISKKSIVSWTSLMCGYSLQGETEVVFALFEQMKEQGMSPNEVTFICLLTACSHAGLTDKGRDYFNAMRCEYGMRASVKHYACMVDLLGRANCVEEALKMVRGMPFEADAVIWKAVLSACRKWNNVMVGKVAYESLLKLNDRDGAVYILMASICGDVQAHNLLLLPSRAFAGQVGGTGQTWWTDKAGKVHKFVGVNKALFPGDSKSHAFASSCTPS